MRKLIVLFALTAAPVWGLAQNEVGSELDQLYTDAQQTGLITDTAPANTGATTVLDSGEVVDVAAPAPVASGPSSRNGQPIYILNNSTSGANAQNEVNQMQSNGMRVQTQPTTVIEAAPLGESRADQIRKQRMGVEMQTELQIVEKLEQTRMEDERRRAQKLFGKPFQDMQQDQMQVTLQPQPQPRPQAVAIAAPVVVAPQDENFDDREAQSTNIKNEIREAIADMKDEKKDEGNEKYYVSGIVGLGEYFDAVNVRSNIAAGFGVGMKMDDRFIVESNFIYSNYEVEDVTTSLYYPRITNMDQYSVVGQLKYQVFGGRVRPTVGVAAAYSYREYTDTQFYISSNDASSHALDLGLTGGVDVELTQRFSIGADFRYMKNVMNRTSTSSSQSFVNSSSQVGTAIEKMSYYVFSVNGRFSF